jgi:hypothetical protein
VWLVAGEVAFASLQSIEYNYRRRPDAVSQDAPETFSIFTSPSPVHSGFAHDSSMYSGYVDSWSLPFHAW